MQREENNYARSTFSAEDLPPLSRNDSEEFLSQYVKQRKARDKYTKEWIEIRETIQESSISSKSGSKKGKSEKRINGEHRPRSSRKKEKEKAPQMFNHFTLNKDPEVSKYMPYDSVAYPKMDRGIAGPSHAAEMETMWMSGLLDYTEHSATKILGGNVAPFVALPGPGILPAAKKELRKMEKKREQSIVENADYTPRFEEHVNGVEEKKAEKAHHALAPDEVSQLRRLARSLEPIVKKTRFERNMDVYKKENKKIRRVLAGEKPIKAEVAVSSEAMADVFEICRREYVAALSLQRFWRRYLVRRQWKLRVFQALQIVKVQAAARGFISRRLVAAWYQERLRLAIQWQARIRGGLRTIKFRRKLALEIRSVTHIQRVVRGSLARRRFVALRRSLHALQIQRLWRGCVARAEADRAWLAKKLTLIQARVRGMLCRSQLANLSSERGEKARDIQRCWRGFFDRRVRDVRLFDRETIFREKVVAELASEGSYWHNELMNKQRLYRKKNFEQLDAELLAEEETLNSEIKGLEANYVEMMRQRRQISPRGLEQGWREELDENTKNHREMITEKKLYLNFDLLLRRRSNHEKMVKTKEELTVARFTSDKFSDWREAEIASGLERENNHKHEQAATLHQKEVAHERRKWQVHFHIPSGKPDKKRRPGRPWDPSVFSQKDTFCGGAADVFAFNQSVDKLRMGSESSLQKIMGQVQTQNFLNEVQSLDGLLKPLVKPLQEMQHDTPLWEEKQQEKEHLKKYPWVPSNEEMGAPYSAASPAQPKNMLQPPRPPGYPNPKKMGSERGNTSNSQRSSSNVSGGGGGGGAEGGGEQSEADGPLDDTGSLLDGVPTSSLDAFAREKARRKERVETDAKRVTRNPRTKAARRYRPPVSRIPWTLLDELEAEKHKLSLEKAVSGLGFNK